ncbi:MAG: transcription initiation factor IIB [Vezdaea aestivalis]|nr:MAG: transcription initiation factor IIB [Vezdaea aestivalis]
MADGSAPQQGEYEDDLNVRLMCPECKEMPPNITEEFSSGDVVCTSCGLVLGEKIIDTRSEWRTFSNDNQENDDPSRVGSEENLLLNGSQLTTSISYGAGGIKGRELIRAQNKLSQDKTSKGLLEAYKEIGAYCDALKMPKVAIDHAKHLYKLVDDSKAFKGKSTRGVLAGCIFLACRANKVGRTFKEVDVITKVPKKEIGRIFKQLEQFFTKLNESSTRPGPPRPPPPASTSAEVGQICIRYCSALGLGKEVTFLSQAIAERETTTGALAGRSPLSAAAAFIYMASHLVGKGKSSQEIAPVARVSDGTIKAAYKELLKHQDTLFDPEWIKSGRINLDKLPVS